MSKPTRTDWAITTSSQDGSDTDSPVALEILRDGKMTANIYCEYGKSSRLDRGKVATRFWQSIFLDKIATAAPGVVVPYAKDFPDGVRDHSVEWL